MDSRPLTGPLFLQWEVPGLAPFADHLAAVALRNRPVADLGSLRPWMVWPLLGLLSLVIALANPPIGIGLLASVLIFGVYFKVLAPREMAKNIRKPLTAHEPFTVTLDAAGVHNVGPNTADHLRWTVFSEADIDEDVLVLRRRDVKLIHVIPLMTLDASVDRAVLRDELGRLISASAPPAA